MTTRSLKNKTVQIMIIAMLLFGGAGWQAKADEMSSKVLENPYNRLAAQLDSKGQELSRREQALNALEAKLEKSYLQVFGLVGFLFVLILVNFILDYKRRRSLVNKQ
jgi:hypothetical protein